MDIGRESNMEFRIPKKLLEVMEERERIFELMYVTYPTSRGEEEIHVSEFSDKSISSILLKDMRMNSYARDAIYPKLSDKALIEEAKYFLTQCKTPKFPCATYDEALIHKIVPELIKRLEEK
jgi:hypothetical protein